MSLSKSQKVRLKSYRDQMASYSDDELVEIHKTSSVRLERVAAKSVLLKRFAPRDSVGLQYWNFRSKDPVIQRHQEAFFAQPAVVAHIDQKRAAADEVDRLCGSTTQGGGR